MNTVRRDFYMRARNRACELSRTKWGKESGVYGGGRVLIKMAERKNRKENERCSERLHGKSVKTKKAIARHVRSRPK